MVLGKEDDSEDNVKDEKEEKSDDRDSEDNVKDEKDEKKDEKEEEKDEVPFILPFNAVPFP
jgi:negative regulator of genetic competence, sporulation and motility